MLSVVKYFLRKIKAHRVDAYAAQTAFFLMMAIVPLLIMVFSLASVLPISATDFLRGLSGVFPSLIDSLFADIIESAFENSSTVMTSFSAIAVIWSASKSAYHLIGGMNSVYEQKETRHFIKVRALSIFYTIVFIVMLVVVLVLMVFGTLIANGIAAEFPELSGLMNMLSSLRFVIGLLLLTFLFALMFKVLPNRKSTFTLQLPGAVVAAVGWVLFSFAFSFYINNFSNYANVYGSLAAIVILMLWLYVCMYILFIGAELNLLVERSQETDTNS